jgi:hypothetical protein
MDMDTGTDIDTDKGMDADKDMGMDTDMDIRRFFRHNVGLRRLQSDNGGSNVRLSPISFVTISDCMLTYGVELHKLCFVEKSGNKMYR